MVAEKIEPDESPHDRANANKTTAVRPVKVTPEGEVVYVDRGDIPALPHVDSAKQREAMFGIVGMLKDSSTFNADAWIAEIRRDRDAASEGRFTGDE